MLRKISARKILNSRGQETIEVEVQTDKGFGVASAPAGASTGKHEVIAFPHGVDFAVIFVNEKVNTALRGMDESKQKQVDEKLKEVDGTENFSEMGGSASIATSLAVLNAAANVAKKPLFQFLNPKSETFPYPLGNVVGGGAHGGGSDIQEFLLIPLGAKTVQEAVITNAKLHAKVGQLLAKKDNTFLKSRNDEGGWVTGLGTYQILEVLTSAIAEIAPESKIGMDLAASQLWDGQNYVYKKDNKKFSKEEQIDFIADLMKKYPIVYAEDALQEEDMEGFAELTKKAKGLICGDDLFVTNAAKLAQGIGIGACNSLIIKPNQNGSVTGTLEVMRQAREAGYACIVSHRSGETTDASISHIAVAEEAQLLKTGIVGGERIAKLNELIRMWEKAKSPKMVKISL